jgi:hypothetical protein
MADYTQYIGGGTTLMIRDYGGWVDFFVQTGASTWNNDQQYSFYANGGGSGTRKFRLLRGGGWQYVDHVYITYDQDISFTLYGAGIGFPTGTVYAHIQRSTTPQAPTLDSVTAISGSAFHIAFHGNYDGGSAIVEGQIGYGDNPYGPNSIVSSGWTADIGGFYNGQRIYFWARVRNALGWSDWSNRGEDVTWQVPPPSDPPTFYDITQTSLGVSFPFYYRGTGPYNEESEFAYGTDPSGAVLDGTFTFDTYIEYLYDLDPGQTYYFWGRARNPVGWGPWSGPFAATLIAGARVLVDGQWQRAIPYVNVGGVWKVAEPWIKDSGVWKRTAQ